MNGRDRLSGGTVLKSMLSLRKAVGCAETTSARVEQIARSLYRDFVPKILASRTRYHGAGKWHCHVCVGRAVASL